VHGAKGGCGAAGCSDPCWLGFSAPETNHAERDTREGKKGEVVVDGDNVRTEGRIVTVPVA